MIVYTENREYAERILGASLAWESLSGQFSDDQTGDIVPALFGSAEVLRTVVSRPGEWRFLFVVKTAPESQYDTLIRLSQAGRELPHGLLCLAGTGSKLHGFKGRPWAALPGNIHLSVFLAPDRKIEHFGVGFTILSAVAVVEALDGIPGLKRKARLKWVNDILLDDAKVGGVLAHTQSQGDVVTSAVLGIGLNVESRPAVTRDPVVPRVASLRDFVSDPETCTEGLVFNSLTRTLAHNYRLLSGGQYCKLLDQYRRRSAIIGKEVIIHQDSERGEMGTEVARGAVRAIGEDLELYLEGSEEPVRKGRLVIKT